MSWARSSNQAVDKGAPRVFLDTDPDKTGIKAEFVAGVADGLNVELGLGPIKGQCRRWSRADKRR